MENGIKRTGEMRMDMHDDNRLELIERYKKQLVESTNIKSSPDEMAVIDSILFRFWQMGWLKEQEAVPADTKMTDKNTVMGWLEGLTWDDWPRWHSDSEVQETAKAALKVMKELDAKRVLSDRECEVSPYHYERKGFCPKCHQEVKFILNRNYCGFCGQAVRWE